MKSFILTIDIFFITTIQLITAFCLAFGLDKYIFQESHENDEHTSSIMLLLETCLFCGIVGVVTYFIGIVIRYIPFPLDGWYGYKHSSYDEVKLLSILSIFTIVFCDSIQYKLTLLKERL